MKENKRKKETLKKCRKKKEIVAKKTEWEIEEVCHVHLFPQLFFHLLHSPSVSCLPFVVVVVVVVVAVVDTKWWQQLTMDWFCRLLGNITTEKLWPNFLGQEAFRPFLHSRNLSVFAAVALFISVGTFTRYCGFYLRWFYPNARLIRPCFWT